MQRCCFCQVDRTLGEFESVRGNTRRHECKNCRREARQRRASSTGRSDDTVSIVSGGASHLDIQSDEPYLHLEAQIRQLTADVRNGLTNVDVKRLIRMEIAILNQRESSKPDPLWSILLIVALSTCMFIILRWLESQLASVRQTRAEENHSPPCCRGCSQNLINESNH